MSCESLNVLLIGENWKKVSIVVRKLERNGFRCQFAASYSQARSLAVTGAIELVLTTIPPRGHAISSLAATLEGTHASLFYALSVEDGCWWLPALRNGSRCLGDPALRPAEFTRLLDEVIENALARRKGTQEAQQSLFGSPPEEPLEAGVAAALPHSEAAA